MFTATYGCTWYDLILASNPYWELFHKYVLYITCYAIFTNIIDLHSQNFINISLFELVFTRTKTHIFVLGFSIAYVFLSIIKYLCCLFLLGKICTLNIQHCNTWNQHRVYTIFEKNTHFSCFIVGHMRLQHATLITRKGVYLPSSRSRG